MAKSRSEIIGDIEDYVGRIGGKWNEWFVGVGPSAKAALFQRHGVQETTDPWIARTAKDEYEAYDIAEYFLTTRHTQGRPGAKHETDLHVYAYHISGHTKQK